MHEFTKGELEKLQTCAGNWLRELKNAVVAPLGKHLGHPLPTEIQTLIDQVEVARHACSKAMSVAKEPPGHFRVPMDDHHLPYLKGAVIYERQYVAREQQKRIAVSTDANHTRILEGPIKEFEKLMSAPWFKETLGCRVPPLSNYIATKVLESDDLVPKLPARRYHDKLQILQSRSIFFDDLGYYRAHCSVRDKPLSVAFMDIDDFKKINTVCGGETNTDRQVLPYFMRALEAHVFCKGHAYCEGGDEYLVLLPNMTSDEAARCLAGFQRTLQTLEYPTKAVRPTVSIGICTINGATAYTDQEIENIANQAEQRAKKEHKGRIVIAHLPPTPGVEPEFEPLEAPAGDK